MRLHPTAWVLLVVLIAGLLAPAAAGGGREVFVDARPRRRAPIWYDDLPAWKQAHPLAGGEWVIGSAGKAESEEAARRIALAEVKALYGVSGGAAAKATFIEEDSFLRVFGPDARTPKWYYLSVLFRADMGPPTPQQAYQKAVAMGRKAMQEGRLIEARAYFLTAESIRGKQNFSQLPPVVELRVVAARIKSQQDLAAAAERAARKRDTEGAIASFARAAQRADELGMAAAAVYARSRVEELKRGEFDRWIVFARESMTWKDEDTRRRIKEEADVVGPALQELVAERGMGVVSLDVAGLAPNAATPRIVQVARSQNASVLLLGKLKATFRTMYPARPYSDVKMPTARGQGTIEVIDLRSGEVIWKRSLTANGFGQMTEQEACEDALSKLAKDAAKLLAKDAVKLGL